MEMESAGNEQAAGESQRARSESTQLPASMLAKEFAKIYVKDTGNEREVQYVLLVDELSGALAEGWRTGLAMDASASMTEWFGKNLCGEIPPEVLKEYEGKGWAKYVERDGESFLSLQKEAYQDALQRGVVKYTENIVEPVVRDFAGYLAAELDAGGQTSLIYWACGDGGDYEVIGDIAEADCAELAVTGPKSKAWGRGTKLTPAMRHFMQHFSDAPRAACVFVTDGRLDDLEDVKQCTTELAKAVDAKKRGMLKCVLIGVGREIDEDQMTELDDLDTGTEIDIWDHKIAAEMRALSEIMVELVDQFVTDSAATVYNDQGEVAHRFADGLPAQGSFSLPASSRFFELEVGEQRIRQAVIVDT
jgi:hypothetical protein